MTSPFAQPGGLPMRVAMARQGNILVARVTGFHTPGPVTAVVAEIEGELSRLGLTRLLLDLREIVGLVTAADHLADAKVMVERLKPVRWATLVREEQYSGAGQGYCIQQGCVMDTFFDEYDAIEWLASGRAPGR